MTVTRGSLASLRRRWRHWMGGLPPLGALLRRGAYRPRPGSAAYERHAREEVEHYKAVFSEAAAEGPSGPESLLEPACPAWHEIERLVQEYVRKATGDDYFGHLVTRLRRRSNVRMLSLGSGPGGVELSLARQARSAEVLCLDLNPHLLKLGRETAAAENLRVRFEQADLNTAKLPADAYDLVLCYASLHHIVELERLVDQIRGTLHTDGELVVVDVVARNGYRMWPETRKVVRALWRTLPPRYRINRTEGRDQEPESDIWEADTRADGMECIRSEDILPVLSRSFTPVHFVPYLGFSRRFFNAMYGPNYDLSRELDRAILHWIWELDCDYVSSGQLRPENFFGIYKPRR